MCLLEFEEEETAIEMPCHHLFHSNCILPWLSKVLLPFSQPSPCPGPSSQAAFCLWTTGGIRDGRGIGVGFGSWRRFLAYQDQTWARTLHCFSQTNSCPLCRHELPTDDDTYEEYRRDKVGGWVSGVGGDGAP